MRSLPTIVPAQDIVNSLLRWRGCVRAAAEELGMRRNSLYERIERLGLDLAGFRAATKVSGFGNRESMSGVSGSMPGRSVMSGREVPSGRARKTAGAPCTRAARAPIVQNVQATAEDETDAAPIRTRPVRPRPIRVQPENHDRLRDAKRRLCALFNVESDESLLLNQFIEERLEVWIREKEGLASKGTRKRAAEADRQ